ncbi:MAG: hypothetical protein QXZ44_05865, partial [Ferroplasma sp.]
MDDKCKLSINGLEIKKESHTLISNLNIVLNDGEDLLLYSQNKLISTLTSIFTFDALGKLSFNGEVIYKNQNLVSFINNIRKFEVNGKNITVLSHLMADIFSIPATPSGLFTHDIPIGHQLIDFFSYKSR